MKATHDGTCQICGARQRLPGNHLANHGYSVQWHEFVGICPGSKELPFEQSRALLGDHLKALKSSEAQRTEELASWEGPATTLHGYVELRGSGRISKRTRFWGRLSEGRQQGRRVIIVTGQNDEQHSVTTFYGSLPSLQEYADQCRREVYAELQSKLRLLQRHIAQQQKRFDQWQPREALPLTGSAEARAERPPKPPTKKEQAAAKFRASFTAKYGREPLWNAHQTTNNNDALFEFAHLIDTLGRDREGAFAGYADERQTKPFKQAASKVMNLYGLDAFLTWLAEQLGYEQGLMVEWDARAREFRTLDGRRGNCLTDFLPSLDAARQLLDRGPTPVPDASFRGGQDER